MTGTPNGVPVERGRESVGAWTPKKHVMYYMS
jgi:hypothetical protein